MGRTEIKLKELGYMNRPNNKYRFWKENEYWCVYIYVRYNEDGTKAIWGDIKVLQNIDSQDYLDKLQIAFNNMQRDIKIAKGEQSR